MSEDPRYPVEAPGWAAIDRALAAVYRDQVPHQFTSRTPYELDRPHPLPAVAAYEAAVPRHWHLVTYGLTELFDKSSPRVDVSGFGYELTLRVPRRAEETRPPAWTVEVLQALGRHLLTVGEPVDSGHVMALGVALGDGELRHAICVPDPALGKIATPHGSVLFLQIVGLHGDEAELVVGWDLARQVGLVQEIEPLGLTRPERGSWLYDPGCATVVRRYAANILVE